MDLCVYGCVWGEIKFQKMSKCDRLMMVMLSEVYGCIFKCIGCCVLWGGSL